MFVISTKSIATYNISSKVLEDFEKGKGDFKKGHLVEFWIKSFLEKKQGFIPIQDKKTGSNPHRGSN